MGWLFGKKEPKIKTSREDKLFVENGLTWFFRFVYTERYIFRIHYPTHEEFPETSPDVKQNLLRTIQQVSKSIEFSGSVTVLVFNETTLQWDTWQTGIPIGKEAAPIIQVHGSLLKHKAHLITHIVLELCELKLRPLIDDNDDTYWYAEMLATYYGYGLVMLCAYGLAPGAGIPNTPFLDSDLHIYAMALLCRLYNVDHARTEGFLAPEPFAILNKHIENLKGPDEFSRFQGDATSAMRLAPIQQLASRGPYYAQEVIDAYTQLIAIEKDEPIHYNNRGYGYLLNGNFKEAISDFDKCIELDPYYAFAFNNRGYCRLMTGDLAAGLNDIEASELLDAENSFNYRNRGIYYLLKSNPEQALVEMQRAFSMDPETAHIHFWLGKVYFALSQMGKAEEQFALSRAKPELPAPEYPL